MIRRPPRSTRTDTRFPYTTLFRSGEIDFLAPTIPIPSDRGNRTVETFYGASLRILKIQFLVDEAPLDAVAGGKVALLLRENIDLGGPPETRIPLDGAAMFIDQIDRLTPRSEERRVGKESVSTLRSRWWPCI